MIAAIAEQREHYLPIFTGFEKTAAGRELPWLKKLREEAFARFLETGFPTTRMEDWRFTDVSPIADTKFQLADPGGPSSKISHQKITQYQIAQHEIEGTACRMVFVNGRFIPELSSLGNLSEGIRVASLAKQIAEHPETVERHLGRYLNFRRDPFCALNTAFLEDGAYVRIGRGLVSAAPIYLLFVTAGDGAPLMTHPRNLVVVEQGAEATVVEDYVALDNNPAFSNTATEAIVEDGAILHHYMIERENTRSFNISTLRLEQGRNTSAASHSILTGGAIVRNNVHPVLAGPGAECLINGLFIGTGRQHLDNFMLVEHASPHCGSRQFYNGILDQQSHGVFHGRIIVHKNAQKTDAKQTNRNLLLSDDAQIDTKPQLEIFADDVKCTHGATIGQLEDTALFYLRSRGIDEKAARQLLLRAFAGECLDRMKAGAARSYAEHYIHEYILRLADPRGAGQPNSVSQGKTR